MTEQWGIAELAAEFGVTTRTIRFYEDKGLISPERRGQRRVYHPRDKVRLQLIMRGKRLGFSLDEIQAMIDLYDADPSEVSQLQLFLDKLRQRKAQLLGQRDDIEMALDEIDRREKQCENLLNDKQSEPRQPKAGQQASG
ncbi:MAG: MerR family DNA-binding transcriptional regulator [Rhodospirillaceae bacterium]|nr:MerR family DNA-binding transcriptional regulator [Rhodospirillaceae bacterium]MBT3909354.1 MerR family DNA-binding transcriptional regulator [Rhodospirillaceae bacterium]MBT5298590.1 MerR family DNA-binding transcriptional regulator [Rhodospirillaceae bacterium]MBT5512978.1 MerR family DNA-binding transcriptional regulator [Rhodospirillaceae bacterium]MBT6085858.1 MerR family DNA-binding transcriptional regulator [Rhodospirillaceae bacterium]